MNRLVIRIAPIVTVLALAACAVTPPAPPDCSGPWTPINAAQQNPAR